jgi:hypothetical protein
MMYVSEAGLLNTSGVLITNKICSSNTITDQITYDDSICPSQICCCILWTSYMYVKLA